MKTRNQIIHDLGEARHELQVLIQDMQAQDELYPGWTVHELVAHIIGWDNLVLTALQTHLAGGEPALMTERGIDKYNARSVASRSGWSLEQVLIEWEATRQRLVDLIHKLPEERWNAPLTTPWGSTSSLDKFLGIFAHHEREHSQEIASHRQERFGNSTG